MSSSIRPLEPETPNKKTHVSRLKVISNIFILSLLALYGTVTFLLASNYKNIVFAIRRPDIMEAARQVEDEETRLIQVKIAEAKKQTLQKILSPLVVTNEK